MASNVESKPTQVMITMYDYIMVNERLADEYRVNVELIPKEVLQEELVLVSMIGLDKWIDQRTSNFK